ncbi:MULTISPECIES: helix-turn-helix transcriptional regulator [Vibrio]|nr:MULTISPECIES: helix-turn-helix transcriptional regulator [Vibrio]MCR9573336.1 helix-turn-helix domain-containing protein [Vibrio alginolyticus]MDW1825406.1 helix-turn-helix transcriptional regulator [Vibrio sp. Vb0937]MDW3187196.1 helix-turn-helix transcriptional regulator [Vibrio sp. Vb0932]
MASTQLWNSQMTPEDKQLYKELGQRIAQTRKALGLTQTQVAEQLGISQQTLAHYEVGRGIDPYTTGRDLIQLGR